MSEDGWEDYSFSVNNYEAFSNNIVLKKSSNSYLVLLMEMNWNVP